MNNTIKKLFVAATITMLASNCALAMRNNQQKRRKKFLAILEKLEKSTKKKQPSSMIKKNKQKTNNLSSNTSKEKNKSEICSICLENLYDFKPEHSKTHKLETKKLECGHEFHNSCISKWLKNENEQCPLCRKITQYRSELDIEKEKLEESRKQRKEKILQEKINKALKIQKLIDKLSIICKRDAAELTFSKEASLLTLQIKNELEKNGFYSSVITPYERFCNNDHFCNDCLDRCTNNTINTKKPKLLDISNITKLAITFTEPGYIEYHINPLRHSQARQNSHASDNISDSSSDSGISDIRQPNRLEAEIGEISDSEDYDYFGRSFS